MSSQKDKINVQRSDGEIEHLTPEELEQLNYERKIRDQHNAGKRVTPKQINIAAVIICLLGMLYALPKMIWQSPKGESSYIPLSERTEISSSDNPTFADTDTLPETSIALSEEASELEIVERASTEEVSLTEPLSLTTDEDINIPLEDVVSSAIESWAVSWSSQNVAAYISHYANSFVSERGLNIEQWEGDRSRRILDPSWIDVSLLRMEINVVSPTMATARFEQIYSASNYSDQSRKELRLILEEGQWKIERELSLD